MEDTNPTMAAVRSKPRTDYPGCRIRDSFCLTAVAYSGRTSRVIATRQRT